MDTGTEDGIYGHINERNESKDTRTEKKYGCVNESKYEIRTLKTELG